MQLDTTEEFAQKADRNDPLAGFRQRFVIPQHEGRDCIYFCGNSLGLMPKSARQFLDNELDAWGKYGVEGHFKGPKWMYYHKELTEPAARLVGAKNAEEVVIMNNLTVNLHLMLVSFYRPVGKRIKILTEAGAFPSDQYALESQLRFHGFSTEEALIEVAPRPGEHTLRTEDILARIEAEKDTLALVMMGGVNYYTGQFFELGKITAAAHKVGAKAGFDLAHGVGNLELHLHRDQVDFAVWCSYKYLNSGPGGTSGVFVHENHRQNSEIQRFAGWWGHEEESRFQMKPGFKPMPGAQGWQLSNAQIFPMAIHKASLEIFEEAGGMSVLNQKSRQMTAYAEYLIKDLNNRQNALKINIITPADPAQRGCQLSLVITQGNGRKLFDFLSENGLISDWREPDVIRIAPVPLYNTFADIFAFYRLLSDYAIRIEN